MFSLFRRRRPKELRNMPRYSVDQFLTVYDEEKIVLLGRVDDLSMGGMCVLSELSIPLGNKVKLAIEIPLEDGGADTIMQQCESVWIHGDESSGLHKIGFRFLAISPNNMKKIHRIITCQPGLAGSTAFHQGQG
jgi:c-di-GMP-binding flagellar brake protein YcgR